MAINQTSQLLAYLAEDQRSFGEIAWYWAVQTSQPKDVLIAAVVKSFWKGEFEHDGRSDLFVLLPPDSANFERKPGNYAVRAGGLTVRIGEDFHSYLTAERQQGSLSRQAVAEVLGGMPECIPWAWDRSEEGLLGFSTVPYSTWPAPMQARYAGWCVRRDDFARWYQCSALRVTAPLDQFWPARVDGSERENIDMERAGKMKASFIKIREAVEAERANGARLELLKPGERIARLARRMKQSGLTDVEIPNERTFREFFRKYPAKPEKSG